MNIIKYQLVGEARYSDLKEQLWFDVVIEQCHLAPLWAWDKIEEPGERSTSFTKIAQGSGEAFTDYLQSLVSAINKAVSDPDVRQMVIEILAFENGNNECKRVIRPLKVQTAPMDKCIRDMFPYVPSPPPTLSACFLSLPSSSIPQKGRPPPPCPLIPEYQVTFLFLPPIFCLKKDWENDWAVWKIGGENEGIWKTKELLYSLVFLKRCRVGCATGKISGRDGSTWKVSSAKRGKTKGLRPGDWARELELLEEQSEQTGLEGSLQSLHFHFQVPAFPGGAGSLVCSCEETTMQVTGLKKNSLF